MSGQNVLALSVPASMLPSASSLNSSYLTTQPLAPNHKEEILTFLAERPLQTVAMAGMIYDNGVVSPHNRGAFYGCRDEAGNLKGVALVGHATLIETRCDAALALFARVAQSYSRIHIIMGEEAEVQGFWNYYSEGGQRMRVQCREMLFEQRYPMAVSEVVHGLRLAAQSDLEPLVQVQAQMALEESGRNPLEIDPIGFRRRYSRRIESGRVWLLTEDERLIFKADVQSETHEVIYLEGIYVNPENRGNGYGLRCLSQLNRELLKRVKSTCLLVNETNWKAQSFYLSAGFKLRGGYDTIFLHTQEQ